MAAIPGALLFDWMDPQNKPPLRLRLGNAAVEPKVDRPSALDGVAETIRYRSVWPGVDAVIRTTPTGVAYDVIVQPGTSPSAIVLEYDNVTELTIGSDGRLRGRGPADDWSDSVPESWQDGPSGREMVPTSYQLRGGTRFGFVVGPYDPSRPLVVDPSIEPASKPEQRGRPSPIRTGSPGAPPESSARAGQQRALSSSLEVRPASTASCTSTRVSRRPRA